MRGPHALGWLVVVAGALGGALGGGTAEAGSRADAIARHADADVAALRAELPGDAAVRCTLGAIYAARGDLSRASLYLEPCDSAALADDLAAPVARARREVAVKLRASELAGIDVLTDPEGAWAEVDALPGETFLTPQMIWVPAGHHVVTATGADGRAYTNAIDAKPHAQGPLMIAISAPVAAAAHAGNVDLSDDNAGDTEAAPPPDQKHPSLVPQHFVDGGTVGGPQLEDPLAHGMPGRGPARSYRLGVRFGGGVFDHSGADARLGVAVAAVLAVPLTARLAFAARLDWSRRGGTSGGAGPGGMHGVDALGATAGVVVTLAHLPALDILAGGGARVAVALEDTMDASRGSLAGAAWLEVPLRETPLTLGVRFEQGVTAFAPAARDQALLAELGLDF